MGYLKAVYLYSNLHAEGFRRSVCALWPWCDPEGTDSQAPHRMTEALPLLCHPLLSWAGTYWQSPWRCRALFSLEVAKAMEGHSMALISPQLCRHQREAQQPDGDPQTPLSPPLPHPWSVGAGDKRHTHRFRTQIHKFLICEKYKMKPCTSYVQTLFTRQESYHWLLQMTG